MGQDMEDFLEELQGQRQQGQRQPEIDRRQQPARGIHGVFDESFHERGTAVNKGAPSIAGTPLLRQLQLPDNLWITVWTKPE
ncbi:hypothetical protein D3C80_1061560 [compost metagenome]